MVEEFKYLRVMQGDGCYRTRFNFELEQLTHNESFVRFVKSQHIRWFGHLLRMPDGINVKKSYRHSNTGPNREVGRNIAG